MFITDFDGVICDSVLECLLVTYNAHKRLQSPDFKRVLDLETVELSIRERFRKLRPYLKGAEDFVPMYIAIEENISITTQRDFDEVRSTHKDRLLTYQKAFYAERDYLQHHEKERWLRLNPLFDGIGAMLKQRTSFENIHILTTKRQQDVLEIFQYQGIPFPVEQITYMKASGKSQKLLEILREHHAVMQESVYIEDQIDFVVESKKHGIGSYLVEWGYISVEQRTLAKQHEIPIIGIKEFGELLDF